MFEQWTTHDTVRLIDSSRRAELRPPPLLLPVRLSIAEAGLRWDAARWGYYYRDRGELAAMRGDLAEVAEVLRLMRLDDTPFDCSWGPGQQIPIYAPVGDRTMAPSNVLLVRHWLLNPFNSVPLMVHKITALYWRFRDLGDGDETAQLKACYAYNTGDLEGTAPGGRYASNAVAYQLAGPRARAVLADVGIEEDEVPLEAIAAIRTELHKMYAQAAAHEQNGQHDEAARLWSYVNSIIAAYPPLGIAV